MKCIIYIKLGLRNCKIKKLRFLTRIGPMYENEMHTKKYTKIKIA
jgi:hypothetical protein